MKVMLACWHAVSGDDDGMGRRIWNRGQKIGNRGQRIGNRGQRDIYSNVGRRGLVALPCCARGN